MTTTVTMSPARGAAALAGAELRLLVRNRLVAFTALVMPLLMGGLLGFNTDLFGPQATPALQIVVVLVIAVYAGATTSLTARRQDGYLKRLRSGELSDATILTGLLAPLFLLGVAQAVVLAGAMVAFGGAAPADPVLVALGVLGGAVLFCAAAVATSGLTRAPETAQITTLPLFVGVTIGAFLVLAQPLADPPVWVSAVPGAVHLIQLGWAPPDPAADWTTSLIDALPALGATIAWIVIAVLVATSTFRWDPRR